MAEKGIIFTGENPLKIRRGEKTQTRRIVKPQPAPGDTFEFVDGELFVNEISGDAHMRTRIPSRYEVGDKLYVKEAYRIYLGRDARIEYCAGGVRNIDHRSDEFLDLCDAEAKGKDTNLYDKELAAYRKKLPPPRDIRRNPMYMPKWMAQTWITVTKVSVERVQDISEKDAKAEGCEIDDEPCDHPRRSCADVGCLGQTRKSTFCGRWVKLNGYQSWKKNEYVWVYTFKVISTNGWAGLA